MINFELVSPKEKLVSEPVRLVTMPGTEGEIGVGAGHSSLVLSLKSGVVKFIIKDGEDPQKIFIVSGFADVTGQSCVVLAEGAVKVSDLDQNEIEREIKDLNENLGLAEEPVDKALIQKKLAVARAKFSAVTGEFVFLTESK